MNAFINAVIDNAVGVLAAVSPLVFFAAAVI
jgi:hypothetical protein